MGEGYGALVGVDATFPWEKDGAPGNNHQHNVKIDPFYLDVSPVSCSDYAKYLQETKYEPTDERGFLRGWPDWRNGKFPKSHDKVPVTTVSLREARLYCSHVGGRLPSSIEWQ
jgi:formylglycine-generating enzyme required for sulfatase activity